MEALLVAAAFIALIASIGLAGLLAWVIRLREAARRKDETFAVELSRLSSGMVTLQARLARLEALRAEGQAASTPEAAASAAEPSPTRQPEHQPERPPARAGTPAASPVPSSPAVAARGPAAPRAATSPVLAAKVPSSPPDGLERELTTRVAVWVGALALALAGALFVKWSFDRGLLGPTTRVALGSAFGVGLVGVGEWLRRGSARVAQGLVASGVSILFAALLAGTSLYGVLPRPVGFALLAATTAGAVVLALRHGPLIALLGLLGGFLTPALIGAEEPNPWSLFGYLFLLVGGLMAASRRRGWWPIAALTLAGAFAWSLAALYDLDRFGMTSTAPVALFLLATIGATVALVHSADWSDRRIPIGLVWTAAGGGVLLLGTTVSVAGFGAPEWGFFALLSAGCLALGWREADYEGLPWSSSLAGAVLLVLWSRGEHPDPARLAWTALGVGGLHLAGSYAAAWRSQRGDRWAALAAVTGLAWFLAAYAGHPEAPWPLPWAAESLAGAALFAALAVPVVRRRSTLARGDGTLAALAVAATAFLSLAVPLQWEREWITVAWAVEIPAVLWIGWRLRVPFLDRVAMALAAVVAVRLFLNPAVLFDYPIGTGFPLNGLLFGYGLPAAAFVAASSLARRAGRAVLSETLETGAVLAGAALVTLETRQYFHPGEIGAAGFTLSEWGALSVVWILYGLALLAARDATRRRVLEWSGTAAGLWGLALAVIACCFASNPLAVAHHVGATPLFNSLLGVYLLPAALGAVLARRLRRIEPGPLPILAGASALGLLFAFVSLTVRQLFHGDVLAGGVTTVAEKYAYSAAWVLLATALLVAGIVTRGAVVRAGSAVIMAAAVVKAFLYDTAQLHDLYRVASLLGLGASLMLLAFLYQRFVFGDRAGFSSRSPDEPRPASGAGEEASGSHTRTATPGIAMPDSSPGAEPKVMSAGR